MTVRQDDNLFLPFPLHSSPLMRQRRGWALSLIRNATRGAWGAMRLRLDLGRGKSALVFPRISHPKGGCAGRQFECKRLTGVTIIDGEGAAAKGGLQNPNFLRLGQDDNPPILKFSCRFRGGYRGGVFWCFPKGILGAVRTVEQFSFSLWLSTKLLGAGGRCGMPCPLQLD